MEWPHAPFIPESFIAHANDVLVQTQNTLMVMSKQQAVMELTLAQHQSMNISKPPTPPRQLTPPWHFVQPPPPPRPVTQPSRHFVQPPPPPRPVTQPQLFVQPAPPLQHFVQPPVTQPSRHFVQPPPPPRPVTQPQLFVQPAPPLQHFVQPPVTQQQLFVQPAPPQLFVRPAPLQVAQPSRPATQPPPTYQAALMSSVTQQQHQQMVPKSRNPLELPELPDCMPCIPGEAPEERYARFLCNLKQVHNAITVTKYHRLLALAEGGYDDYEESCAEVAAEVDAILAVTKEQITEVKNAIERMTVARN